MPRMGRSGHADKGEMVKLGDDREGRMRQEGTGEMEMCNVRCAGRGTQGRQEEKTRGQRGWEMAKEKMKGARRNGRVGG